MRRLSMVTSLLLMVCGIFMIWMAYGFVLMLDPDERGTWADRFHRLTTDGASPVGLGLLLVVVGGWLALSKPKPPT